LSPTGTKGKGFRGTTQFFAQSKHFRGLNAAVKRRGLLITVRSAAKLRNELRARSLLPAFQPGGRSL